MQYVINFFANQYWEMILFQKIKKSLKNVKEDLETVPYTVVATHHVGQNSVSLDNKVRKKVIQNSFSSNTVDSMSILLRVQFSK